ncbi:rna methyltransferase [Trichoderma arundinaceum]|uniref:rRNA methyltransferase 1, mitochondrial n=1 Tax=Trichoderma arundinaceum TaxID=490622 RepID=A0A395NPU5_TRIAR|nr:rna methyltransferase [Trichoderma arundinaceum]
MLISSIYIFSLTQAIWQSFKRQGVMRQLVASCLTERMVGARPRQFKRPNTIGAHQHKPGNMEPVPWSKLSKDINRPASLSAIHRGVRRSERIQFGDASRDRDSSSRGRSDRLTRRALDGAASPRQQQKLRKKLGRKEAEDQDEESDKQTRRKRFLNPDFDYGKKSLVYQLKHGAFKHQAAALVQEPVRPLPFQRLETNSRRRTESPRFVAERSERPSRSDGRPAIRRGDAHGEVESPLPRERRNQMMAMNIKYTTAASQFLYGKSVVKAALEQGRRQLYKLFIYGGENRKDSKDNAVITRLAERRGVPITIIPNEDQRLMDKMSMGRPHNGFVLETSPLPQLPVKSLGNLEETPGKLGFHVELDYQSKEEEAINGQDTFVPRKSHNAPKPFVLLLNEILDPGNLGGILRTASYLGVDAVGITNRSSSTLTPVVLKSAAGAVEEITIFSVDSPVSFIEESKKAGWKTYAAVAPPDPKLAQRHGDKFISTAVVEMEQPLTRHPCVLVLGNEGHGLSKPLKVAADYELSVPYFVHNSCVDSLNVSVAAGLLCHSFVRTPSITKSTVTKVEKEIVSETESGAEKDESRGEKETLF